MAKSRIVTVSALQFACTDDVSTNVDTAERLVRAAHQKGANIILIQELFEGYYFCQAQMEDFFRRAKPRKEHPTILRCEDSISRSSPLTLCPECFTLIRR
ncbi:N-carbamoylputrescine amidase [Handroanthus impetiginosus]|uniref:N-carbamoylputrescine amidase n=1 Tax=Handroanthus impetiginosus TaxID=429701 RepID=A0A2G9G5A3_9LAMI|nr:N-carbamoylputrescine amidase [Handroanthus impetiginosus]